MRLTEPDVPLLCFYLSCAVASSVKWRYAERDTGWHFSKGSKDYSNHFLLTVSKKEKKKNKNEKSW
jgi:hypothetical protein